jgi:hypothetical protein
MTIAFAETATGWGTAQGGTATGDGGGAGPTITGLAETANATGSAFSGRMQLVLHPATATSSGAVGGAQVSSVSPRQLVHAGTPVSRNAPHAAEATRLPVFVHS